MDEFSRACALLADKREDEALDWFEIASESAAEATVRASASAHVAALLCGFRRPWEVAEFTGRLRRNGGDAALADMLDASACVQLGDSTGALELVGDRGDVATPIDQWYPCSQAGMWAVRIRALHLAVRETEAFAELHRAFRTLAGDRNLTAPLWEVTATLVADRVLDPRDVLPYLAPSDTTAMFGWIAGAPVAGIRGLAEAIWSERPNDPSVLAAATLFAWQLDADDALVWSLRLAESGASPRSPVHERAERTGVEPDQRARAAIAGAVLDVDRSRAALELAVASVEDEGLLELFDVCVERAGTLADSFIVAAATTAPRCLLLSSELVRRGNEHEALAVLVAGLSLPSAENLTRDVFARLVPQPERVVLTAVAREHGEPDVVAILESVSS